MNKSVILSHRAVLEAPQVSLNFVISVRELKVLIKGTTQIFFLPLWANFTFSWLEDEYNNKDKRLFISKMVCAESLHVLM